MIGTDAELLALCPSAVTSASRGSFALFEFLAERSRLRRNASSPVLSLGHNSSSWWTEGDNVTVEVRHWRRQHEGLSR